MNESTKICGAGDEAGSRGGGRDWLHARVELPQLFAGERAKLAVLVVRETRRDFARPAQSSETSDGNSGSCHGFSKKIRQKLGLELFLREGIAGIETTVQAAHGGEVRLCEGPDRTHRGMQGC